jgi:hypothetical protein
VELVPHRHAFVIINSAALLRVDRPASPDHRRRCRSRALLEDVDAGRPYGPRDPACARGPIQGGMTAGLRIQSWRNLRQAGASPSRSCSGDDRRDPDWEGATTASAGPITDAWPASWACVSLGTRVGQPSGGSASPGAAGDAFALDFEVEAYLEAHAMKFTGQFDANCYLYLSRASDLFDVAEHGGSVRQAWRGSGRTRARRRRETACCFHRPTAELTLEHGREAAKCTCGTAAIQGRFLPGRHGPPPVLAASFCRGLQARPGRSRRSRSYNTLAVMRRLRRGRRWRHRVACVAL